MIDREEIERAIGGELEKQPVICVDLDGVLAYTLPDDRLFDLFDIGSPIPGAREFLEELSLLGRVVILTARCNTRQHLYPEDVLRSNVERWLDDNGMYYDEVYVGGGKPTADVYVDDHAVFCAPEGTGGAFDAALDGVRTLVGRPEIGG